MSQTPNATYRTLAAIESTTDLDAWLAVANYESQPDRLAIVERVPSAIASDTATVKRIYAQIKKAATLRHDGLAPCRGMFRSNGEYFLARDFIAGETLDFLSSEFRRRGATSVPIALAVRAITEIAAAFAEAERQVGEAALHSQLHPGVLYMKYSGSALVAGHGMETLKRAVAEKRGGAAGPRLHYSAPEQCQGGQVDVRTDIFALGVVLWELLTLQSLFSRSAPYETMQAICEEKAPKPSSVNAAVPSQIDAICSRALQKNPSARYQNWNDFVGALEGLLQMPEIAGESMRVSARLQEMFPQRRELWERVEKAEQQKNWPRANQFVQKLFDETPTELNNPFESGESAAADDGDGADLTDSGREALRDSLGSLDENLVDQVFGGDQPADTADTTERQPPEETVSDEERDKRLSSLLKNARGGEKKADPKKTAMGLPTSGTENDADADGFFESDEATQEIEFTDDEVRAADAGATHESDYDRDGALEETAQTEAPDQVRDAWSAEPTEEVSADAFESDMFALDDDDVETAVSAPPEELLEEESRASFDQPDDEIDFGGGSLDETSTADETLERDAASLEGTHEGEPNVDETEVRDSWDAADEPAPEEPERPEEQVAHPGTDADVDRHPDEPDDAYDRDGDLDHALPDSKDLAVTSSKQLGLPGGVSLGAGFDNLDWSEALSQFDEDDEEPEDYEPAFDIDEILEKPGAARMPSQQNRASRCVMEVVRVRDDQVLNVETLQGVSRFYRHKAAPFKATLKFKSATLKFTRDADATFYHRNAQDGAGEPLSTDEKTELRAGDSVEVVDDDVTYRIRVFRPPHSPMRDEPQITGGKVAVYAVALLLALVFHGGGLLLVLFVDSLGVSLTVEDKPKQEEVFAEGKLKKPDKPEKKEPEPPKPPTPKPEPKPVDPTEQKAQLPESVQKKIDKQIKKKSSSSSAKTETESAIEAIAGGPPGDAKSKISNIDAIKGKKGGGSGDVSIRSQLGSISGDEPTIKTGGGGSLQGAGDGVSKDIGKLAKRSGSNKVRGKVSGQRSRSKVTGGTLSRSDVYKTINKYIGSIQRCYERELMSDPSLGGKITFEWTVDTSGGVKGVRERSSSVGSRKVSSCIMRVIRRMKFPRPKGGEAEIAYPFVFESQ
jgi:hypothetical protein